MSLYGSYAESNKHRRAKDIRAAEKTKQRYPGAAAECATFIPFIVDSLGNFGPGAWQIIDLIVGADLAQSATGDQHTTPDLTRMNIARAIAIQIQAGNAAIDLDALVANGVPLHINQHHPHHLSHPASPKPQRPTRPQLPASVHDTLLRPPSPISSIPSVRRATAAATEPTSTEGKGELHPRERQQHEQHEIKRCGSSSPSTPTTTTSSSSSSASAVTFLQTTSDLADFTATASSSSSSSSNTPRYIDDNIPALSSSSSPPIHSFTSSSSSSPSPSRFPLGLHATIGRPS